MRNNRLCAVVIVAAILAAGAGGFFVARQFQRGPANIIYFPERQIGYYIGLSLEVVDITRVSMTDKTEFVQFKVRPWNGKIDTQSLDFFRKYETQEFTVVLPADSPAAASARIGDVLNCYGAKSER